MRLKWIESTDEIGSRVLSAEYKGSRMMIIISPNSVCPVCYIEKDRCIYPIAHTASITEAKERLIRNARKIAMEYRGRWHKWPQEDPDKNGWYLVTVSYTLDDSDTRDRNIDIWVYHEDRGFFKPDWMGLPEAHVVAWTELPAYGGEA